MQRAVLSFVGIVGLSVSLASVPVTAQPLAAVGDPWLLGGNILTNSDKEFLGTANKSALVLKVNNQRALRIEPAPNSPNLLGGYSANAAAAGVDGATIGGGGSKDYPNTVVSSFGTVGGGQGNRAGYSDTVAGGFDNSGTGQSTSIGGGFRNTASGEGTTIAGGVANTASATRATVGGGNFNTAAGQYASVAGGFQNSADGDYASVGGGQNNTATTNATVGGGSSNASGSEVATVGGGQYNAASAYGATVGGGEANAATGFVSLVAGGGSNSASGRFATVGGGNTNTATAPYATISGGGRTVETTYTTGNRVTDSYGTVGGGGNNQVGDNAGSNADRSFATIAGGKDNVASGAFATVDGGAANKSTGSYATVNGGQYNTASGAYSSAAGRRAKATQTGSWVWADAVAFDFAATAANQFNVRATGGTRIISAVDPSTGVPAAGVQLPAGSGSWSTLSDRNAKMDLVTIDPHDILAQLATVPIATWRYKTQDATVRHIGPMAQDFYRTFGLGEDAQHISTVDADGVALAAIQALADQNATLQARVAALEASRTSSVDVPLLWVIGLGGCMALNAVALMYMGVFRRRRG